MLQSIGAEKRFVANTKRKHNLNLLKLQCSKHNDIKEALPAKRVFRCASWCCYVYEALISSSSIHQLVQLFSLQKRFRLRAYCASLSFVYVNLAQFFLNTLSRSSERRKFFHVDTVLSHYALRLCDTLQPEKVAIHFTVVQRLYMHALIMTQFLRPGLLQNFLEYLLNLGGCVIAQLKVATFSDTYEDGRASAA